MRIIFMILASVFMLGAQDVYAQPASASWTPVSTVATPTVAGNTGNVSGADEVLSNLTITTNFSATTYQKLTVPGGSWVAESAQSDSRFVQFSVKPTSGNNFSISNISLSIGAEGGTGMKANVAYSIDSTFATSTVLYASGTSTLPSGSFIDLANDPGLMLLNGQTLYLRIFPYYKSVASGKYLDVKNVLISGTTSSSKSVPVLSTTSVTNISSSSAQSGGAISLDGESAITQKGVVWSTSINPTTISNTGMTNNGTGTAAFVSTLSGLAPNTVYHVRAYATNSTGTGYGQDIQFATTLAATNYYNKPNSDISDPVNWGTNTNGTGIHPIDFSTDAQAFNIVNSNATLLSDWVVSGTDSKVILGNGTQPQAFTIPTAHGLDGTIDVKAGSTLTVQNTTGLTFGALSSTASIIFDGTTAVILNYPNLGLLRNANLPAVGTIGIAGTFNPDTTFVATPGSTVVFNGTGAQVIPTSFTYSILNLINPATTFHGNLHVDSVLSQNINLVVDSLDTLSLNPGATLTVAASKTLTVKGTFDNKSGDAVVLNGNMTVEPHATYKVNANVSTGYLIPAGTYKPASELLILQGQGKLPATVGGNVTWSSDRSTTILSNVVNTIGGNFTITAGGVSNGSSTGRSLSIGGNLNIAGGLYTITSSGFNNGSSMTVNGNVTITSGGLNLGNTFDSFYLYIKGNLLHTGGTFGFGSSSNTTVFNFTGTNQTISTIGLANAGTLKIGGPSSVPTVKLLSDLTINTGGLLKVADGSLTIAPTKTLTIKGTADFNGKNVVFKSDSTGTASLGQITNPILNGNNVTVERYISSLNNRALRLLAPSVNSAGSIHDNWQTGSAGTGTHITGSTTGANGFDATVTGEPSMSTFNVDITPTTDIVPAWINLPNTDVKKLEADTGYLVYIKGDRTINLSDSSASINTTLRSTGSLVTGTRTFNSLRPTVYNLITNPYASAISWTGIRTSNPDLVDRYIYLDPNIGSRGGYVMVNGDGSTTPSFIPVNQGLNIQSGEAFFVRPLNTTSVTINETHKSTVNNKDVFRTNDGSIEKLASSLFFTLPNGTRRIADGVTSVYQNDYTTTLGPEDALQIANFDEDVAILSNGKLLAIEGRPLIDSTSTIQLNVTGLKAQKYEWQFNPTNFSSAGITASLSDKFLGTSTPISLTDSTVIKFTVTANASSYAADRFKIVFAAATPCLGANTWTGAASTMWENPANWSCGIVPDANTDVVINLGTVVVNANASCKSLTTASGVNFIVNPGITFTVTH